MSHFTVLVIGDNPEKQLEPYCELDLSREELEHDSRAIFEKEFKSVELQKMFEEFKEKNKLDIKMGLEDYWVKYRTCSAEEWQDSWSENYLNKDGTHYGYYHNPNAKWDWFQVGGRWGGTLKLKDGGASDEAIKGDVDFSIDKEKYNRSVRFWEIYIEGQKPENDSEKELAKTMYKKEYFIDRYKNKNDYATQSASFGTYAVLKNGEWFGKGEMGWFGCSSETHDEANDWSKSYYEQFIADLTDDTTLTIVDCHI